MRKAFFGALALLLLPASFAAAAAPSSALPSAEELLERSIRYHDPANLFLTEAHVLGFRETRPEAEDRLTRVLIDVPGERFEMRRSTEVEEAGIVTRDRCEMTLHDRRPSAAEGERYNCDRIRRMADYYTYLWGLPRKLRDPGTRLGQVTRGSFQGRDVFTFRVTYDPEVGTDTWYFHFAPETAALVGYRFYHDETEGDGEYIVLEGETTRADLRLPKSRTWYTHQGDRLLGTDHLLAIEPVDATTEPIFREPE